jgi:hypothetical protein
LIGLLTCAAQVGFFLSISILILIHIHASLFAVNSASVFHSAPVYAYLWHFQYLFLVKILSWLYNKPFKNILKGCHLELLVIP